MPYKSSRGCIGYSKHHTQSSRQDMWYARFVIKSLRMSQWIQYWPKLDIFGGNNFDYLDCHTQHILCKQDYEPFI